jgi:hypothetical protein
MDYISSITVTYEIIKNGSFRRINTGYLNASSESLYPERQMLADQYFS